MRLSKKFMCGSNSRRNVPFSSSFPFSRRNALHFGLLTMCTQSAQKLNFKKRRNISSTRSNSNCDKWNVDEANAFDERDDEQRERKVLNIDAKMNGNGNQEILWSKKIKTRMEKRKMKSDDCVVMHTKTSSPTLISMAFPCACFWIFYSTNEDFSKFVGVTNALKRFCNMSHVETIQLKTRRKVNEAMTSFAKSEKEKR